MSSRLCAPVDMEGSGLGRGVMEGSRKIHGRVTEDSWKGHGRFMEGSRKMCIHLDPIKKCVWGGGGAGHTNLGEHNPLRSHPHPPPLPPSPPLTHLGKQKGDDHVMYPAGEPALWTPPNAMALYQYVDQDLCARVGKCGHCFPFASGSLAPSV